MDDVGRRQPRLGKSRRVKVVAATRPQHRPADPQRFASCYAGEEQRRGCIIRERTILCRCLVQGAAPQPSPAEPAVEFGKPERHDPVLDHRRRDRPQMRERGCKRGVGSGHEWQTLHVPFMFRYDLQQVKRFERPDPGARRVSARGLRGRTDKIRSGNKS